MNIGAVIGLLPITGVPLPLISEGLSSLLVTMVALGMLMSFARHEPGAAQALAAAGPSVPRRVLSWLGLGRRTAAGRAASQAAAAAAVRPRQGGRAARAAQGGRRREVGRMSLSVVIAGGGSGGHIEPALALADALRRADPATRITCLGTERGLETRLVPNRGYDLALIPPVPLPRPLTPQLLSVPRRMAEAVGRAAGVLDQARADVLVGFGGYVATPGYLAARRHQVPIVVHEANARPGLANRIGALLTTHVFTGQPGTKLPHGRYIGIPIRREIASLDRLAAGDKARAHFGLRPDLPVLLVTGGSQGARSLNYAVLEAAGTLRVGRASRCCTSSARAAEIDVSVPPRGRALRRAAVRGPDGPGATRPPTSPSAAAGAMTCAELTAVGLPAAYVPLPHGNGEQRLNAAADRGSAAAA